MCTLCYSHHATFHEVPQAENLLVATNTNTTTILVIVLIVLVVVLAY